MFLISFLKLLDDFFQKIGERVGYNNMIYSEHEIDRIARVAGKLSLFQSLYYDDYYFILYIF